MRSVQTRIAWLEFGLQVAPSDNCLSLGTGLFRFHLALLNATGSCPWVEAVAGLELSCGSSLLVWGTHLSLKLAVSAWFHRFSA